MDINSTTTAAEAIAYREAERANKVTVIRFDSPQLKSCSEVESERRNFCVDYENFYRAMDIVRKALPQTYTEIYENPEGCTLASRILHRLRECAMAEIPYGAVSPNKGWDGKRV